MILLEVSPANSSAGGCAPSELDRFERAAAEFHLRVEAGFRELAAADPERWVIVDADGPAVTEAAIRTAVRDRLGL